MPRKTIKKKTVRKKPATKKPRVVGSTENPFEKFLKPPTESKTAQSARLLKKYFVMRSRMNLRAETAGKKLEVSDTWVRMAETELRKAAKEGYTDINEYIRKGRPCKAGNQVLAE